MTNSGLPYEDMFLIPRIRSRSINPENPTGVAGGGGKEASALGTGRKGRGCIDLPQGKETVLAQMEGPGVIEHMWLTVTDRTKSGDFVLRDLVLKMYWDDEETPSVEVPVGDFFCNGFGRRCVVSSYPIVVNPTGGMNSYFRMPFQKKARLTISNQHAETIKDFFYQISYALTDGISEDAGYFHARWRREAVTQKKRDYVILDNVRGRGKYVGTYLGIAALERYWYGEGEIKFYIDTDEKWPTICGTGTEDYFGGAWAFHTHVNGEVKEQTFNTMFLGYPFYSGQDDTFPEPVFGDDAVPMHGFYRWHFPDPIVFHDKIKVTIQQIGLRNHGLWERSDDVCSVAYWYQKEPHSPFPSLLKPDERWPR